MLVLILFVLSISFVTSAAIVEAGLGLSSPSACHAAVIICLAFYVGSKVTMYVNSVVCTFAELPVAMVVPMMRLSLTGLYRYVFLVERAHALRAPYMRRCRDWIWLAGMLTIGCGFGTIALCGFIWPIADMSELDGRCRIGLPLKGE